MKVFYSELAENPAYYSFGYSVYAELEGGDSVRDTFEKGFLPCVIAKAQPARLMYQTRGVRILATEFERRHYHHRVVRKAEALGALTLSVHPVSEFSTDAAFKQFFLDYFTFRFGRGAVAPERLDAILASPWVTHVSVCRLEGEPVAYMLEHHSDGLVHVWYQAYEKRYEHAHLGSYLYVELMERAKAAGKEHVYFGVTYGPWMKYKANFAPLEYWTGAVWERDANGKKLKELLGGGVQSIAYADRWRAAHEPFYPTPSFPGLAREARFIQTMLDGAPRLTLLILLVPLLIMMAVFVRSYF